MMRRFNWRSGSNISGDSALKNGGRKLKSLAGRKSTKRSKSSSLLLETLERRELLAADILHNGLIAQDVNGDFRVTSLDALGIVNHLNAVSRGAIAEGESTSTSVSANRSPMLDVNNDSRVTSLDLLAVINKINTRAEGEDILAQVNQIAVGTDGIELPFTTVNGVKQYTIGVGTQFSIRTQVLDNRNSIAGNTASGVFGAYLDIQYGNVVTSAQETVQAQYSEFLSIDISSGAGGSFRLRFDTATGPQETADIAIGSNTTQTNNNIRNAVAALPFVGGASNISMLQPFTRSNGTTNFGLNFVNGLIRTDVPNAVVTNAVLSPPTPVINATASTANDLLTVDITNAVGGTFRLSFNTTSGTQVTGDIAVGTNAETSANIRAAVAALAFSGGSGNITAQPPSVLGGGRTSFSFKFTNTATLDAVTAVTVTNASLTPTPPTVTPTSTFDPTSFSVFAPAMTYPTTPLVDSNRDVQYNQIPTGSLANPSPGVYIVDEAGSAKSDGTEYSDSQFVSIFDVRFRAAVSGLVEFTTNNSDDPTEGITLFNGGDAKLPDANIQFSSPIRINVVDKIQAVNDTYPTSGTILEDSAQVVLANVTGNDIVFAGTLVGITAVTQPAGGTVTFTPNGQDVRFTPAANFFGQTTFTYTVANNLGDTSVGTVTVNVTGVNDPPILITPAPTAPSIAEDTATPLTVAASTFFLPGPGGETGAVRFNSASLVNPASGTLSINANGELVFLPAANFFGSVPVTVTARDAGGAVSTSVTIQLNVTPVNDSPVALGPTFTTNEDTQLTLSGTQLFTPGPANESTQTITLANAALAPGQTGATVSINGSGQLVVVPTANFFGNVIIAVDGTDNGSPALTTRGTFTITVNAVNDPPTATADNFVVVSFTGTEQELTVLSNDSAGPGEPNSDLRITRILNHTGTGTVRIAADGRSIFYLPPAGQATGSDSFTYEISDSTNPAIALTAQANVTIDIVPPVLPFAVRDTRSIAEGTASTTIDVMANDLINNGSTRSLVSFTQPTSGTVTRDDNGTPANTSDDKLIFAPSSADFFGQVTFTYVLDDSSANSDPSTGTVTVVVTEVNDAPTVVASQNATTTEDAVDFQITGATLLAGSSAGPLETNQTVSLQSAQVISGGGSVAVRNGNLFYTAASNFVGNVIVQFTATDNGTTNGVADPKTATGRVTIAITPVNDAPIAANDTATTPEDTTLDIPFSSVLSNDRPGPANAADELANQTLTVTAVSVVSGGGTATIVGTNIRYVPAANANGPVVLQYTIQDSETVATAGFTPLTATAQIAINVTSVNDAPANLTATRSVFAGLPTNINLSAELAATSRGAANEASQTLKINRIIPGSVQGGTATLNADGTVTFTAPTGSSGTGSFQVETIDNGTTNGVSDPKTGTGTVTINIAPFQPSTISGHVWIDDDYDGTIDSDEHMVAGVTVTLKGTTVAEGNNSYSNSIVTGADGSFSFDVLPPGTYTLSYTNPNGTIDGAAPNQVSYTVAVPGGKSLVTNFNINGVKVALASVLDNLVEGYYNSHPEARGKGVDAVINADGSMAFSSVHGGYSNVRFAEVVLTNGGRDAILSIVGEDMSVRTAVIPRGKFFVTRDDTGTTYVRIVAMESELSFFSIGNAPASTSQNANFLDSVDAYFASFK